MLLQSLHSMTARYVQRKSAPHDKPDGTQSDDVQHLPDLVYSKLGALFATPDIRPRFLCASHTVTLPMLGQAQKSKCNYRGGKFVSQSARRVVICLGRDRILLHVQYFMERSEHESLVKQDHQRHKTRSQVRESFVSAR